MTSHVSIKGETTLKHNAFRWNRPAGYSGLLRRLRLLATTRHWDPERSEGEALQGHMEERANQPEIITLSQRSKPRREARHHHDDRDLEAALNCGRLDVHAHPASDLLAVGLRLLHLEIDAQVGRQQIAEALHGQHRD